MTFFKAAPAVLGMAILGAAFLPIAKADDHDKLTTVTFSAPVEIPPRLHNRYANIAGWNICGKRWWSRVPIATSCRSTTKTKAKSTLPFWRIPKTIV